MATLNGINLGIITKETQAKNSNLFINPLPLSDSSQSILLDVFGTQRDITITGEIVGNTSTLTGFISNIEAIQNGKQEGVAYVGDLVTSSKNVFINTFDWDYNGGEPTRLTYTLGLIEGLDISA